LKVLLQNSSKGFTLIELLFGLIIMLLIGGFAMNAFIDSSKTFSKDKKTIDSSQNLSAILEMVGTDIKQAGEQINEPSFPVIKIEPNTDAGSMVGSSKITIRRALTSSLTLCENIAANSAIGSNRILVVDDSLTNTSCKIGTVTPRALPAPVTLPNTLWAARDKRCQLDDINGNYTVANTDFCSGSADESILAVMSDQTGNIRTFTYVGDTEVTANSKYQINIKPGSLSASTPVNTGTYAAGSPIYLLEERIYTLDNTGQFKVQIDGKNPETLIKRIQQFKVSARVYGDKTTKQSDRIDPLDVTPDTINVLPLARRCDAAIPYYICSFNAAGVDDWKTLQGIKVELDGKYDATGQDATASAKDLEKLAAKAEFFPRNVLSK
jgi:prepilin-type N-terminal cleavage/methylation domain-containing protein